MRAGAWAIGGTAVGIAAVVVAELWLALPAEHRLWWWVQPGSLVAVALWLGLASVPAVLAVVGFEGRPSVVRGWLIAIACATWAASGGVILGIAVWMDGGEWPDAATGLPEVLPGTSVVWLCCAAACLLATVGLIVERFRFASRP